MFTGQSLGSRGGTGSPESLSAGCEPGCPTPPPKGPRAECGNQPGSGAPGPSSTGFPAPLAGTPRYVAAFRASSATSSGRPHHVRKRTNALVSLGAALSLSPSDPAWGSRRPSSGRLAASRFPPTPSSTLQPPTAAAGRRGRCAPERGQHTSQGRHQRATSPRGSVSAAAPRSPLSARRQPLPLLGHGANTTWKQ